MKLMASAFTAMAILTGGGMLPALPAAEHMVQSANEVKWGPAPPMVPPGASIAVVSGNPFASVPYTVRLKFPAGYAIPAHSHPTDENVVVVSGAVTFGSGDKLDKAAAMNKSVGVGGYVLVPAGHNHFAYTTKESTIVLYGIGPVDFKYVNPADDPRNAK